MTCRKINMFIIISIAVIAIDRISKWIIKSNMELNQSIKVIGNFFKISYILNSGIAFGMLDLNPSPFKTPIILITSFIALGIILYIFLSLPKNIKIAGLSMGFIFGGAIGNIIDRIMRGRVVDFVDINFPDISIPFFKIHMIRWPTFNVADSCVFIGIILLLIIIIRVGGKAEPEGEK